MHRLLAFPQSLGATNAPPKIMALDGINSRAASSAFRCAPAQSMNHGVPRGSLRSTASRISRPGVTLRRLCPTLTALHPTLVTFRMLTDCTPVSAFATILITYSHGQAEKSNASAVTRSSSELTNHWRRSTLSPFPKAREPSAPVDALMWQRDERQRLKRDAVEIELRRVVSSMSTRGRSRHHRPTSRGLRATNGMDRSPPTFPDAVRCREFVYAPASRPSEASAETAASETENAWLKACLRCATKGLKPQRYGGPRCDRISSQPEDDASAVRCGERVCK